MTYIINPMWFYWLSVIDKIVVALYVVSFILGIALLYCLIFVIFSDYEEERKKAISIIKLIVPVLAISVMGIILIPTRDVLIEMQVAKLATTENAQWTLDTIKSAVDYIIQAISSL